MEELPNELLLKIFQKLTDRLSLLTKVCKIWKDIIEYFYDTKRIRTLHRVACESESLYTFFKSFGNFLTYSDLASYNYNAQRQQDYPTPLFAKLCKEHFSCQLFLKIVSTESRSLINELIQYVPSPFTSEPSKYIVTWGHSPLFFVWNENVEKVLPWYVSYLEENYSTNLDTVLTHVLNVNHLTRYKMWNYFWNCSFESLFLIRDFVSVQIFRRLFEKARKCLTPKCHDNFDEGMMKLRKLGQMLLVDENDKKHWLKSFARKVFTSNIDKQTNEQTLQRYVHELDAYFGNAVDWKSKLFNEYLCKCASKKRFDLFALVHKFDIQPNKFITSRLRKFGEDPRFVHALIAILPEFKRKEHKHRIVNDLVIYILNDENISEFGTLIFDDPTISFHDFTAPVIHFMYNHLPDRLWAIQIASYGKWMGGCSNQGFEEIVQLFSEFFKDHPQLRPGGILCIHNLFFNNFGKKVYCIPYEVRHESQYQPFLRKLVKVNQKFQFIKTDCEPEDLIHFNFENALVLLSNQENLWFHVELMNHVQVLLKHHIPFPRNYSTFERSKFDFIKADVLMWLHERGFVFDRDKLTKHLINLDRIDLLHSFDNPNVNMLKKHYPEFRTNDFQTTKVSDFDDFE